MICLHETAGVLDQIGSADLNSLLFELFTNGQNDEFEKTDASITVNIAVVDKS